MTRGENFPPETCNVGGGGDRNLCSLLRDMKQRASNCAPIQLQLVPLLLLLAPPPVSVENANSLL